MTLFKKVSHSLAYRTEYLAASYCKARSRSRLIKKLNLDADCGFVLAQLENLYVLANYRDRVGRLVDIGANCGGFAKPVISTFKLDEIICVEPDISLHPILLEKMPSTTKLFSEAISSGEGVANFNIHPDRSMNSLVDVGAEFSELNPFYGRESIRACEVKTRSLDSLLREMGENNERNILLKIDVQGHEMAVLRSGELFLNQVSVLVAEHTFWQGYKKDYDFQIMVDWLGVRGFEIQEILNVTYRDSRTAFADFVFIRRDS